MMNMNAAEQERRNMAEMGRTLDRAVEKWTPR